MRLEPIGGTNACALPLVQEWSTFRYLIGKGVREFSTWAQFELPPQLKLEGNSSCPPQLE